MSRRTVVMLVTVGVAAFAAGAYAQDAAHWIGAAPSNVSVERYEMSVGVTAGQLPRLPSKFEEVRDVLHVPAHYGQLAYVTGDGGTAVFWFRDAEGALRNVVVHDSSSRAVKLTCTPTSRYESDAR